MANIVLKTLEFSNMFSYGNNNKISLNSNKISQLTAPNGSGKSSIAIILQEILFNKNIKGIKKADIINRYSKSNSWLAKLDFLINEKDYTIKIERTGAKSSVQFSSSKEDFTEHKVLDTYKKIQETLNLDFDVFSQLTYQSSIDLLEFLKATDTNRKKFLINLFNLEKYVKIGEALKIKSNSLDKELATLQGELNSIDSFLSSTEIPEKIVLTDIPETNQDVIKSLALLEKEVEEYEQTCKKIDKNNMYIQERELLEFDMSMKAPHTDPNMFSDLEELNQDVTKAKLHKQNIEKSLIDIDMSDTCYACGQTIDNSQSKQLHKDLNNDLCNTVIKIEGLLEELEYAKERVNSYQYDV